MSQPAFEAFPIDTLQSVKRQVSPEILLTETNVLDQPDYPVEYKRLLLQKQNHEPCQLEE